MEKDRVKGNGKNKNHTKNMMSYQIELGTFIHRSILYCSASSERKVCLTKCGSNTVVDEGSKMLVMFCSSRL